ncbi:hypothetical protein [Treponema sp.]|uniref:hypothetical protein n=1 Tax=Treponema sp. TaxID=166 RepID=UPI00298EA36F|nr:hypothetical protein [Treponema sp.]MCR5613538.1 hypothetical protein [Treponema sp.]
MFKKAFLIMTAACAVTFGFVSCDNINNIAATAADNSTATTASTSSSAASVTDYSSYYGTYEGSVMKQAVNIKVSENSVDQGGNYGAYTKVLWLKNNDNKVVVAAQSNSTNTKNGDLTTENYLTASSCYIIFENDGTASYFVPAMTKMMKDGSKIYRYETKTVTATLSCFVNAMGGQEFGTPVYKGAKVTKKADGTYKVTVSLGKGTGNIYGVNFDAFVDPRNSKPGYYNTSGVKTDAEFTVSETDTAKANTGLDENGNRVLEDVNYVTSMTFPVTTDVSEYTLWLYINSNVMGVQFCDGKGTAGSGEPDKQSKYVGKLTIDWNSFN